MLTVVVLANEHSVLRNEGYYPTFFMLSYVFIIYWHFVGGCLTACNKSLQAIFTHANP